MKNNLIAQRYAKAMLLNLNSAEYNDLRSDVKYLAEIFQQDKNFIKSLDSLMFPIHKRKQAALELVTELSQKNLWQNLFDILLKKQRFSLIDDILTALDQAILQSKNQVHVKLTIAHQQNKAIMKQIEEKISQILKKDIEVEIDLNPKILGGFIAETENYLIDGSVQHNLVKLTKIKKN